MVTFWITIPDPRPDAYLEDVLSARTLHGGRW